MAVATVMVAAPEPVMEVGLKLAVAPGGKPLTLNTTVSAKLPDGVTLALKEAVRPALMVVEPGETEREKSAEAGGGGGGAEGAKAGTRAFAAGEPRPVTKS